MNPKFLTRLLSLLSLIVILLGIVALTQRTRAQGVDCTPGSYSVTDRNVNVRAAASTGARIVTTLRAGSPVTVNGSQQGDVVGGSTLWCVIDASGATAYVHSSLLTTGSSAPTTTNSSGDLLFDSTQLYHVSGSNNVNARQSPSATATILFTIPPRVDVPVVGETTAEAVRGNTGWYVVNFNGQQAYVHSSLLAAGSVSAPAQQESAVQQPSNPQPQQQQSGPASFTCPHNCAGAVAMGLSAEQAATCPGLDRDHDGVACYGN